MSISRKLMGFGLVATFLLQAGCASFGGKQAGPVQTRSADEILTDLEEEKYGVARTDNGSVWDIFRAREDQGRIGDVNKYIWNASLETLDFLPVQTIDPFTGVIVTGYGTPPGSGTSYRATIYVSDPALDARSLNVALMTRSGPVSAATVEAVEDAILTRARQLRKQDSNF